MCDGRSSCSSRADARRLAISSIPDEIWCVFDVDEHPYQADAIRRAEQHGINVAVSTPCLELWFILHFEAQAAHMGRRAAIRRAEALLSCSKTLTDEALQALVSRYEDAVKRARELDVKHAKDRSPPRSNPSSDVWRLIERIQAPLPLTARDLGIVALDRDVCRFDGINVRDPFS
jgi:RloB-like protein